MLRDCFGPCFRLMLRLPDSPPTGRTDVRREAFGSKKQPIPDVYGELRNRLAGRTPAPASHDPGHPGANNRNTTPGRSS